MYSAFIIVCLIGAATCQIGISPDQFRTEEQCLDWERANAPENDVVVYAYKSMADVDVEVVERGCATQAGAFERMNSVLEFRASQEPS